MSFTCKIPRSHDNRVGQSEQRPPAWGLCAWEPAQLRGGLCVTGLKRLPTLHTTGTAKLQLHAFGSQRGARQQQKVLQEPQAQTQTQARFREPDAPCGNPGHPLTHRLNPEQELLRPSISTLRWAADCGGSTSRCQWRFAPGRTLGSRQPPQTPSRTAHRLWRSSST